MSGGIDSSMALKYLKKEWDHIIGANHIVWHNVKSSSREVISRAEELCRKENVPFYCLDISEEFKKRVVDDFVKCYAAGRSPNPCVICNETVKFTFFYDKLKKKLIESDLLEPDDELFYATGHYVRLEKREGGLFLKRAADLSKDQSYMLYRVPGEVLKRCLFPLGGFYKKEIIAEAASEGYGFGNVKESQDICFVEGSYGDFIGRYLNKKIPCGRIVDTCGNFLGMHRGYIYYTIGQRKGLGLGNGPWFVLDILPLENVVVVGREEEQGRTFFEVKDLNWFIDYRGEKISVSVQVRYNSSVYRCSVERSENIKEGVVVNLDQKTVITKGQSAVFYDGDIVIGGGIIC